MNEPTSQEMAIIDALRSGGGRVLGRTELARVLGISPLQNRRIDVLLVGVRRVLGPDALVNVRNRGWRLTETAAVSAGRTSATDPS
jgi:DNA-binding winged helix-turn-helix (wHTH) protein